MDDEIINEDLSIINERMSPPRKLEASTFMQPIKDLKFPPPLTLDLNEGLQEAVKFMQREKTGCVLVTSGEQLAGILTERDILTKALGQERYINLKVKDVMTPHPESFQENDEIAYVVKAMCVGGYRHVPIVNEKNVPIGMVSVKGIIRFIVDHFPDQIMNLPPMPIRSKTEIDGA
jgi:CBS domain-containing protein